MHVHVVICSACTRHHATWCMPTVLQQTHWLVGFSSTALVTTPLEYC